MRLTRAVFTAAAIVIALASQVLAEPAIEIQTSMGSIVVELDRVRATRTVDNFLRYVNEGHYDGTLVYRIAPGFVIQAGSYDSPTNSRPVHEPIPLEAGNGLSNQRGTIAMARKSDPDSATAEFFINLADNANLDRQAGDADGMTGYAVFGRVVSGMDVVDKIAAVPVGAGGPMPGHWPQTPVTIVRIRILPSTPLLPPPIPSNALPAPGGR